MFQVSSKICMGRITKILRLFAKARFDRSLTPSPATAQDDGRVWQGTPATFSKIPAAFFCRRTAILNSSFLNFTIYASHMIYLKCRAFSLAVTEMTAAGEYHSNAVFICHVDRFLVTDGAAWLDNRGDACFSCCFDGITEGEERIR